MGTVLNIILTIVLLIAILGILVSAHEAGHFFFAKIFGVYCNEFSIGFGPKIFSKRRKKGETTFSLRVVPLGGYVSMYSAEGQEKEAKRNGEEYVANEEIGPNEMLDANGKPIPLERSLEHKALWKRIIILLAGVAVNFILSFAFCLIYATAYPQYRVGYRMSTGITFSEDSTGIVGSDYGKVNLFASGTENYIIGFISSYDESLGWPEGYIASPALAENNKETEMGYIIDNHAVLTSLGENRDVTALYYPKYETKANDLLSCLTFYNNSDVLIVNENVKNLGVTVMPNMEAGAVGILEGDAISFEIRSVEKDAEGSYSIVTHLVTSTYKEGAWDFSLIQMTPKKAQETYGERLKAGCEQWVSFFPTIGNALKQVFSFNFDNIGGVVAMGASISSLTTYMGAGRTFFLYGGLISLNLAILNLLPFPGLDGWQIVVAIVEKVARKKIPLKAKRIIQIVGFALLAVLAIFIMVKDIIRLV